jgi:hypothetical protein
MDKILHAKLPKDNIYEPDIEALPKAKTVLEWIANFKQVRETGRQKVQEARRYGASLRDSPANNSYKNKSKRERNPQGDEEFHSNTDRQELKRHKKQRKQDKKSSLNTDEPLIVDWSIKQWWTCGMHGHKTDKCWLDNIPAHDDRNIENIQFNKSTKG